VFDADVFILHRFGLLGGVDQESAEFARLVDLLFAALYGGQLGQGVLDLAGEKLAVDAELFENRRDEAVLLPHQRREDVKNAQLGIPVAYCEILRLKQRLAAFVGQFFHVHNSFSPSSENSVIALDDL